jgi:hypothetical protein
MWIFKTKTGASGSIEKLKARIVTKRNEQEVGIYFYETFASVVCWSTIHSIFALAARKQWSLHCLNVTTAFLNGMLTKEVYNTELAIHALDQVHCWDTYFRLRIGHYGNFTPLNFQPLLLSKQ